jgi:hypothetical protein
LGFGLDNKSGPGREKRRRSTTGEKQGGTPIDLGLEVEEEGDTRILKRKCSEVTTFIESVGVSTLTLTETNIKKSKAEALSSGSKQGNDANLETEEEKNNTPSKLSAATSCGHGSIPGNDANHKVEALSPGSKQGHDANPGSEEESNNTHSKLSDTEPVEAPPSEGRTTRGELKAASYLGAIPDDKMLDAIDREKRERKATKADDAEVPVALWEEHLINDGSFGRTMADLPSMRPLMSACRFLMLRWWKRKVTTSLCKWIRKTNPYLENICQWDHVRLNSAAHTWKDGRKKDKYEWLSDGRRKWFDWIRCLKNTCPKDVDSGGDAVARAAESTWWEWAAGSRPFHWRWPTEYIETIRDGLPVYFVRKPPNYTKAQQDIKEKEIKDLVVNKLKKVRGRGYIAPGHVIALICFFEVPKGDCDIRMVYNGSESGLNECMWVPRFILPTVHTHLRGVGPDTYMSDVDLGEFFLNFILHPTIRPYTGVDFTKYFPNAEGTAVWEPWQRAAMGLRSSPYQAVQAMAMAEEVIRGDRLDPKNVFRWDSVKFNLPGSEGYDPSMPWVYKVRLSDGKIAVDVFGFVDDFRQTGNSKEEAWLAARQVASRSNHLGIQDAPRKRRDGSATPGAWTGSIIRTGETGVFLLVSADKWEKTKVLLKEMLTLVQTNPGKIPRKRLEQIRGFLNYVAQTYTWLRPYLIGLHMTIDGWRPNRDSEGWRLQPSMILVKEDLDNEGSNDESDEWLEINSGPECPTFVSAVPRLSGDIEAMQTLCSCEKPPQQRVRCRNVGRAYYGFGDASKSSFGATVQIDDVLEYEYGQWTTEAGETNSSNWRELNNLVEALERTFSTHELGGCEFFMFTDNSTAEAAYWKGTSKSRKLFDLVLRLKELEVKHDIILHVIHVSGKRMIAQGTDGLSRGDHSQGVMQGLPMTAFIPLHLDPFERSPKLKAFVEDICKDLNPKFLSPTEWFTEGHKVGTFVWSPPPAAAEVVVEQLGFARLKRPHSMHIVVIPRLMTGRWRRHMSRGTDFYFKVDWVDIWPLKTHYEPVLIFVCLPYLSHRPDFNGINSLLDRFRGAVLQDNMSGISTRKRRDILRKLFKQTRALCPV